MVATLGRMSKMAVVADKPNVATISPKLSKDGTLLHILGSVAMAARIALGSVFHLGTGGVFLGNGSREMDREQGKMEEKQSEIYVASDEIGYSRSTDDDDCLTDRSPRRGF